MVLDGKDDEALTILLALAEKMWLTNYRSALTNLLISVIAFKHVRQGLEKPRVIDIEKHALASIAAFEKVKLALPDGVDKTGLPEIITKAQSIIEGFR